MSKENKGNAWVTLVPELFYDLIARVPAGAIVVLFSTWVIATPDPTNIKIESLAKLSWALVTILLILLLVFAYATGLFLTAFGDKLYKVFKPRIWQKACEAWRTNLEEYPYLNKYIKQLDDAKFQRNIIDRVDREMYYLLKSVNPQAKDILPKMRAEAALAYNTLSGCILLLLFEFLVLFLRSGSICSKAVELSVLLFLLVLTAVAAPYRSRAYVRTQFTFLVVSGKGGLLTDSKTSGT